MADYRELYVDGGARGNPGPAACGYILKEPEGKIIESEGIFLGETTNNIAEYTGLLKGLQCARKHNIKALHIFSDSELMVKQIIGEYKVKSSNLQPLYHQIQRLLLSFDRWQIRHIPRELNKEADALVNRVLDNKARAETEEHAQSSESVLSLQSQSAEINENKSEHLSSKILVEVIKAPSQGICQADIKEGMCFVFSSVIPAGLCVHAAQSILPTVLAMQRDLSHDSPAIQIRCSNTQCGAIFKLTKI